MSEGESPAAPKAPVALTPDALRKLVGADQLRQAFAIFDGKLVLNPSRSGLRLYAEVKGSGQTPYKVTIDFVDGKEELEKARCNCPAAKFQGQAVCKHAAATLVAWSNASGSFVVMAEAPPEAAESGGKGKARAKVKTGSADTEEQAGKGLAALEALLAELAASGLSTLTQARAQQVRELSENLRPYKLRRLAPECMRFASTVEAAARGDRSFTAERFAAELASLTFQVRGLRKLLARTDTEAEDYKRLADELLGRTWGSKSLTAAASMRLLDLGFTKWTTPDGFVIEQSLLADVSTGELFVDKAIRPQALAKRQPAKENFAHHVLEVSEAGIYPGYAPRRVKLGAFVKHGAAEDDMRSLLAKVPQTAAELHAAFQAHAGDVFAPLPQAVLFRAVQVIASKGKVVAADPGGKGIALKLSDEGVSTLEEALERGPVLAFGGELDVGEGGLVLTPTCVIVGSERAAVVVDFER